MTAELATGRQARRSRSLNTGIVILCILLLAVAVFGAYSFHAWRVAVADNPVTAQQSAIDAVDSIAVTPNETPQTATVKDATKLTASALVHTAQDGDVLLIYNKAGRIIVYRPSVHKIVAMLDVKPASPAASAATNK